VMGAYSIAHQPHSFAEYGAQTHTTGDEHDQPLAFSCSTLRL
jgi:hypothetical protein